MWKVFSFHTLTSNGKKVNIKLLNYILLVLTLKTPKINISLHFTIGTQNNINNIDKETFCKTFYFVEKHYIYTQFIIREKTPNGK